MITLALMAFASIDEAAVAALTEAKRHCETRFECGGYIYKTPAGYQYTYPVTSGNPNGVDLGEVYRLDWGWVADYHTHACVGIKQLNEVFSMQDVLTNKGLHLPGYMLSLCSGYVRRWADGDPEDDFEIDYFGGRKMFLATGHIVGIVR